VESIGNRMKNNYENVTRFYLTRRTPVILRLDGKAFHSLTKNFERPFDRRFIEAMVSAAIDLTDEIQGFKAAYIQSDEVSILLTDYDDVNTQGWFDYNASKITSVSAALMSVRFNFHLGMSNAVFDCRCFNIPKEEVANYFLWRSLDWQRNSIFMYARSFFSHKQLEDKNQQDIHEMLHQIGKNWTTDLENNLKNGTWILRKNVQVDHIKPNYQEISGLVDYLIGL